MASPECPLIQDAPHISRPAERSVAIPSQCASPRFRKAAGFNERVSDACNSAAHHPSVFDIFRPTRCGSGQSSSHPHDRGVSPFPKCRVALASPAMTLSAEFPSLNSPTDLNVLRRGVCETDSIRSPRHTVGRTLRHNRNAVRAFRNAFPTYQEREVRHKGNEPSNLQERGFCADSCKSRDSRPASKAANSLTLLETL